MSELPQHPFGRVEADGTVYVTDGGEERQVGQYPDGTPEEALAYFTRKYDCLLYTSDAADDLLTV